MKLYPLTAHYGFKDTLLSMQAGARTTQSHSLRVSLFSRYLDMYYAQYEFIQKWFNDQKLAELLRMNNYIERENVSRGRIFTLKKWQYNQH